MLTQTILFMISKDLIKKASKTSLLFAMACSMFLSCKKEDVPVNEPKPDVVFYGLKENNRIVRYNAKNTGTAEATIVITGIASGENVLSIDFRPATGQLYALSSSSMLYTIDLNSGLATPLSTTPFSPAITGSVASIDFNPTVDRIRLVTNVGQNLRLNPETGAVVSTDGNINGGTSPAIASIAYSNSFSGTTGTELFDIDMTSRKLYKQTSPNEGVLSLVGTINVNFSGKVGFDINNDNTAFYAMLNVAGVSKLYKIHYATAVSTFIGDFSESLIDIAIPTPPVAYAISETGKLQIFNPGLSNSVIEKTISGIGAGENLMGIDFRPAKNQLYGITMDASGMSKLYTLNLGSGAATAVGSGFMVDPMATAYGFDFNPTVDRIRLVTNTGKNFRLNPNDGTIAATDGLLNPGTPTITGAAYTNNYAGATTTSLFVMDNSKLYRQDPPNAGTLNEIGNLGIVAAEQNGFDISGRSNTAYSLVTLGGATILYTINTTNGTATAGINYPNKVKGLAIGLGF